MLDRDANWGCVRGMINVTPRGAGSCAKKHHSPLVGARGNHKSGLTRRRQEKSRFWGLKRSESHCFLWNYFTVQEKTYGNACPVSTVISCRECFILFGQRAVGPLQFLSVLCFILIY